MHNRRKGEVPRSLAASLALLTAASAAGPLLLLDELGVAPTAEIADAQGAEDQGIGAAPSDCALDGGEMHAEATAVYPDTVIASADAHERGACVVVDLAGVTAASGGYISSIVADS